MTISKNKRYVGGIEVTAFTSMEQAVGAIIKEGVIQPGLAIAINAEKVLSALRSNKVREVIELATLRYADGFPIVWTLRKKGLESTRIPGCDLWLELMKCSSKNKVPVYILGSTAKVNAGVVNKLKKELDVNVVGATDGYFTDESKLISDIISTQPKVITVALGSPKQELLMSRCMAVYPDAFYMGVGGSYDVYTGNVRRAPVWMQNINLEWLYRLIKQPSRIIRQLLAFKYLVLHFMNRL